MSVDRAHKQPPGLYQVFASELVVDVERSGEWIAALWQGAAPAGLVLHSWIVLQNPWRVRFVWEAKDQESLEFYERRCAPFGKFKTEVATDAVPSLATYFTRDAAGFGEWLKKNGMPEDEADYQVALRRNAAAAPSVEAAAAYARDLGPYKKPSCF